MVAQTSKNLEVLKSKLKSEMFFLKELPTKEMIERHIGIIPNEDIDSVGTALLMMKQASLLIRLLESYFKKYGLTQLRFLILMVIDRETNRHSLFAHEIAERLDISRPVLTRAVQALIVEGLLNEKINEQDKRSKQLSLTTASKKLLTKILPGYFSKLSEYMKSIENNQFK